MDEKPPTPERDPPMTQELYDLWREAWQPYHSHQTPPSLDQMNQIMQMMSITALDIFGIEEEELHA